MDENLENYNNYLKCTKHHTTKNTEKTINMLIDHYQYQLDKKKYILQELLLP